LRRGYTGIAGFQGLAPRAVGDPGAQQLAADRGSRR